MITQQRLKDLLHYDLDAGVFVWRVAPCKNIRAGLVAGCRRSDGYVKIGIDGKRYLAHRLVWLYIYGVWPTNNIDHINHNTIDNHIDNLRDVTQVGNLQNQIKARIDSTTGLLGVSVHKPNGKYKAQIRTRGKSKTIGYYATREEAHAAYLAEKRIQHSTCTL